MQYKYLDIQIANKYNCGREEAMFLEKNMWKTHVSWVADYAI